MADENEMSMEEFYQRKLSSSMRFFAKARYTPAEPVKRTIRGWQCKSCHSIVSVQQGQKLAAPESCPTCQNRSFTLLSD